jgi:membrane associated rhomboid family serine protease
MLGLVTLLILIGLAQAARGPDWYGPWMCTPAAITGAWSTLLEIGPAQVDWQPVATLLTCAFLHGSPEHLGSNLIFLWMFGALLNALLGWRWLLGLFGLTAIGASLVQTALEPSSPVPMLGASGAVMGLEGAYFALATRFVLPDPQVWPLARPVTPSRLAAFAVLGVAFDYVAIFGGSTAWIAFGAHVGGFTTGLLIGGLLIPRPAAARHR